MSNAPADATHVSLRFSALHDKTWGVEYWKLDEGLWFRQCPNSEIWIGTLSVPDGLMALSPWPADENSRDKFETLAAEYFGRTLQVIHASRMSNGSYDEPKLAAAWWFYNRGEL